MTYIIFGGESYYASGGAFDILATETTVEAANEKAASFIGKEAVFIRADWSEDRQDDSYVTVEWAHVYSVEAGCIVSRFGGKPYGHGFNYLEVRSPS